MRCEDVRLQRVLQNLAGLDPAARDLVLQVAERLAGPALQAEA